MLAAQLKSKNPLRAQMLALSFMWWCSLPVAGVALAADSLLGERVDDSEFAQALSSTEWSSGSPLPTEPLDEDQAHRDPQVKPTQMFAPSLGLAFSPLPLQLGLQSPPDRRTTAQAGVALGLASIPYMIGDTSAGTCFSIRGITTVDLSHPTLTCARLNVSENNTAIPVDRFYYSYRHFENSSGMQVFQYQEEFNLDVHTFGMEKTFMDGLGSVEMRVPLQYRLRSDLISLIAPDLGAVDVVTGSDDREVDFGNLSFVTKLLLHETSNFALTAGLGVTVPTAKNVTYDIAVDDEILFPLLPGLVGDTQSIFANHYDNETVYLSPFLAWLWTPKQRESRWFHQGFMQVEVAANPSTLTVDGFGFTQFFFNGVDAGTNQFRTPNFEPTDVDVFAQTLLRVNLGVGYQVTDPDSSRLISNLRALFEMHYTTTLQRANVSNIPLEQIGTGVGTVVTQFGAVGNADPRTDILNAAAGFSLDVGRLTVTNGFISPVRRSPDRGFDFEYNLQVQLPY